MNADVLTKFSNYSAWAPVFLRVGLGILFLTHGAGKLFGSSTIGNIFTLGIEGIAPGLEAFGGFLATLSFPMPEVFAVIVALLEFVGGIALLLGVLTRLTALLLSIQFVVIVLYVKALRGGAWEVDLAILGAVLAVLVTGPGIFSLEKKLLGKVRF